jgi:hypothetical protein
MLQREFWALAALREANGGGLRVNSGLIFQGAGESPLQSRETAWTLKGQCHKMVAEVRS